MESIGQLLDKTRLQRQEIAERIGVQPPALSRFVKGTHGLGAERMDKLAALLTAALKEEITVDRLYQLHEQDRRKTEIKTGQFPIPKAGGDVIQEATPKPLRQILIGGLMIQMNELLRGMAYEGDGAYTQDEQRSNAKMVLTMAGWLEGLISGTIDPNDPLFHKPINLPLPAGNVAGVLNPNVKGKMTRIDHPKLPMPVRMAGTQ